MPLISLVGMPGSGKSTVGRQLARQLGLKFFDSDAVVEQRLGMPIRDWFVAHGEESFRDVEQAVVEELTEGADAVIATGGGAVLRPSNRNALHSRSHVLYLRSSAEDLYRRLRHDTHRPLLQVDDPLKKLREMYRERDPLYRRTAHYVVEAARPSVQSLTGMVLMQLELAGIMPPPGAPSAADDPSSRAAEPPTSAASVAAPPPPGPPPPAPAPPATTPPARD